MDTNRFIRNNYLCNEKRGYCKYVFLNMVFACITLDTVYNSISDVIWDKLGT